MEKQCEQFIGTLYKFVSDLDRYHSTSGTRDFISNFKSLNMNKVILRFYKMTDSNIELIKNKDNSLFDSEFMIFPDVDLKYFWQVLTEGQKKKIWIYLNILYTMCDMILYIKNDKKIANKLEKKSNTDVVDKELVKFDPYVGVGTDNPDYDVDEMLTVEYSKNVETEQPGIGSMMNMFGLSNMLDLNKIRDQLKHMSDEDITSATDKINDMLENNDPQTTQLITSILQNINETLNDENIKPSSNPLNDISGIAENVINKLKPEVEKGNIDLSKLIKPIQKMASNAGKNNMFPGGFNPFSLINKFMGQGSAEMSQEEYMNSCKQMCDEMGIKEDDLANMNPSTIQKIMSKLGKK